MATHYLETVTGFSCAGQYAAIVNHWETVDPTPTNLWQIAKAFTDGFISPDAGTAILPAFLPLLSEDSFVSSIRARVVSPAPGNSAATVFQPADYPGTFNGNLDAQQISGCIILLTSGDAALLGRMFIPGVSEEALEAGRFETSYKAAASDLVSAMTEGFEQDNCVFQLCVKHGTPAAFTLVTNAYLSLTPGTQRRRLAPL